MLRDCGDKAVICNRDWNRTVDLELRVLQDHVLGSEEEEVAMVRVGVREQEVLSAPVKVKYIFV